MAKGPQPVAFFALGAGGFTVLQRRWPTLPGLLFCLSLPALATLAWGAAVYRPGALSGWLAYMRLDESVDPLTYLGERAKFAAGLLLDLIPATLLLPAVADLWRRRRFGHAPPVVAALVAYASLGTLALLLWPGAQTRYAMPIAPAVAVLAGITIDRLWRSRPWLARAVLGGTAALAAYQATLVLVAMPLLAERFGATRLAGQALGRAVAAAQAPAVATDIHTNELFYLSLPVRWINAAARGELPVPATLLATRNDLAEIAAARPDLSFQVLVETTAGPGLLAARVDHAGR
jgi:hypothetical protein